MVADRVRAAGGGRWPGRSRRPAGGVVALTVLLALSALGTGCAPVAERAGGIGTATRPGPERAAAGRPEPVSPATVAEPQEPPAPTMTVSFEPAPNASDVRPDTPVRVEVAHGRLTSMAVTSSSGPVPGAFASGTFTPAQPLGFGQPYP